MPIPSNISFATAIDIGTTLPYSTTQDVRDSGINYTVYYKYVEQIGDVEIGVFAFGALSPGYQPVVNYYTGPAGAPVAYTPLANIVSVNIPAQIPATGIPGTEFFFEIVSLTGNTPVTASLALNVYRAPNDPYEIGDILVPDDTESLPGVILDGTTGDVRRFVNPFPAGEAGDILNDGTILAEDLENGDFNLYASDLSFITNVSYFGTGSPRLRTCNGANAFYAGFAQVTGGAGFKRISNLGVAGSLIGPVGSAGLQCLAASNDETIIYYNQGTGLAIKRWDVSGNTGLTDLVAALPDYRVMDILYLDDDTIIILYFKSTVVRNVLIKRFDTSGTLLNTYDLGTAFISNTPRLAYAIDNPNSFWAWTHPSGADAGKSIFQNIKVSDGSILTTFTRREFESAVYNGTATATPDDEFGNSFSCPFFILRTAQEAGTATLTIIKITVPSGSSQSFDFTTTGGLDPNTFSLSDGGLRTYINLTPGEYGITETAVDGWVTGYEVSNSDPHDAIVLAADDVVVVTVTNTFNMSLRSGIYKIVPGKRNDTLWTNVNTGTTEDVKIP